MVPEVPPAEPGQGGDEGGGDVLQVVAGHVQVLHPLPLARGAAGHFEGYSVSARKGKKDNNKKKRKNISIICVAE